MTDKKITAKEIRNKLRKLKMELHKYIGANKLTSQYRIKVTYMLMWLGQIPVNKKSLSGWKMPDMQTINDFSKVKK